MIKERHRRLQISVAEEAKLEPSFKAVKRGQRKPGADNVEPSQALSAIPFWIISPTGQTYQQIEQADPQQATSQQALTSSLENSVYYNNDGSRYREEALGCVQTRFTVQLSITIRST